MCPQSTVHELVVESLTGRVYPETTNALYLWEAYAVARQNRLEIPAEVLDYFDRCAKALANSTYVLSKGKSKGATVDFKDGGTVDTHVCRAVELKVEGRGNYYWRKAQDAADLEIAMKRIETGKTLTRLTDEAGRDESEYRRKSAMAFRNMGMKRTRHKKKK